MAAIPVRHDDLERYWPTAKPFVEMAAKSAKHSYDIEEIEGDILARLAQLWLVPDAGMITGAIVTYTYEVTNGEMCEVRYAGGEMTAGLVALETIEDWARDIGCIAMRVDGRGGWAKKLRPYGYGEIKRTLEKDLI